MPSSQVIEAPGTYRQGFYATCVQVSGPGGEAGLPPEELCPARPNGGSSQAEGQGLCTGTTSRSFSPAAYLFPSNDLKRMAL